MASKRIVKFIVPIVVLLGVYFLGDAPETPQYDKTMPNVPTQAESLENYITSNERLHKLKPDNEARVIWADSTKKKTEYAVVYLHGFSASQKEGDPVHVRFAKQFGCNLYLSRLADHGIDTTEALLNFTADRFWNSGKEALAIGNAIGEKVILIATSSGATLSLMLAAEYPDNVHALINLSPNIAINNPAAFVLNNHWGLQIARIVMGGKYRETTANPEKIKYWYTKYRLEGAVQLQEMLETKMTEDIFKRITHPSLTLYFYKNENVQDPDVKVSAMLTMHDHLGTPDSLKEVQAIPNAMSHVIGGSLMSKDIEGVYKEMVRFAVDKLSMKAVD